MAAVKTPIRNVIPTALVGLAALGLAWVLGWAGALEGYDRGMVDLHHNLAGQRRVPRHTALVLVDDLSLAQHRDEPLVFWGPHFARAIAVLRQVGAKRIGLDFRFMVSAESWLKHLGVEHDQASRTHDGPFRAQLASGQVTLVASLSPGADGQVQLQVPIDDYRFSLPRLDSDIGLDALLPDEDGVIRHFLPAWFEAGPPPRLGLATLLAVRAADLDPDAESWHFGELRLPNRPEPMAIGYCGPPGTFQPLSFSRLLAERAADDPEVQALAGRVVLLGAGFTSAQDVHATPYASGLLGAPGKLMSGPEIHANIVETILSGHLPRPLPGWLVWLIALLLVALATPAFFRLGPLWAALLGVGLGLAELGLAHVLFRQDRLLPVGLGHLALVACYLGAIGLRLTGEERKRQQIRRMFGQYVSEEVVEHLVATGSPNLGGELATVSVLFSDIRDFTTLSERLAPAEVVEMLNTYFSQVTEAILVEGGTIDKFIGDAVMAVFGSPAAQPDHARRALRTALAIESIATRFQEWMGQRFSGRDLPAFDVGIGIHSGEAVVGNIGSQRRMDYTAIGDTVNTASRLEGVTKTVAMRILISSATVAAAGPGLRLSEAITAQIKGRSEPVQVFGFRGFEL